MEEQQDPKEINQPNPKDDSKEEEQQEQQGQQGQVEQIDTSPLAASEQLEEEEEEKDEMLANIQQSARLAKFTDRKPDDEDDEVENEDEILTFEELKDDSVEGFFKHTDPVYCVDFNPKDEAYVVTGGGDDVAYVWDTRDGEKAIYKLEGHTDTVIDCAYSFDGKFIATASMDCTVRLYDGTSGEFVRTLEGPGGEIEWIDWHPKGLVILAGSSDGTCWMWNAVNGECIQVFGSHFGPVLCGGFTRDGKRAFTGSEDGSACVWNLKTGELKHHFKGREFHDGPITCMACHPSKSILLTGSQDKQAKLIHAKNGKTLLKINCHTESVESVGFSNTNSYLATAGLDGLLSVWDTNSSQCRTKCKLEDGIVKLLWHPTSPLIFVAGLEQTVQLWDARSGRIEKTWHGHQRSILDFSVSSDGTRIVTGSDDCASLVFQYNS